MPKSSYGLTCRNGVACRSMSRAGPCVLQWLQQFTQIHQQVLLYSEQIVENGKFSNRQAANYGPAEFQQEIAARV